MIVARAITGPARLGLARLVAVALVIASALALDTAPSQAGPTPEEYAKHLGSAAKIIPPGQLTLDGRRMTCGQRPTVIDDQLDDYGAAYPGFLILNSKLMARVPTAVKQWIYAHECGHQFRGPD